MLFKGLINTSKVVVLRGGLPWRSRSKSKSTDMYLLPLSEFISFSNVSFILVSKEA